MVIYTNFYDLNNKFFFCEFRKTYLNTKFHRDKIHFDDSMKKIPEIFLKMLYEFLKNVFENENEFIMLS